MQIIELSRVTIPPNRQRQEFNPQFLMELAESIGRLGLLQPIVIKPNESNGGVTLVAGERRIRAIKELWSLGGELRCNGGRIPDGFIPTVSIGDLDPIAAFECELEENIRRIDLTWQEKAEAVRRLHELRVQQNPAHLVSDTAREVYDRSDGSYNDNIKKQLIVAKHLDDPDVAKASNFRDAFKIIEKKEDLKNHALRAAIVGQTFGAHSHTLLQGDCITWMQGMDAGRFDVIITDPPYGMGADEFGDGAGKLVSITHDYSDDAESFRALMSEAAFYFDKVAKAAAHLYVCCDLDQFFWLRELFGKDWNVFRTPIINCKVGSGRVPLPEHGPRRTYEIVLYAYRGGKRVTAIYPDVLQSHADENYGHGAQKPIDLYTDLLRRSVRPGDLILDPFCGTGTVFPACHQLQCHATGIELHPGYYGLAAKRIEELK